MLKKNRVVSLEKKLDLYRDDPPDVIELVEREIEAEVESWWNYLRNEAEAAENAYNLILTTAKADLKI